jgi:hypothetical protein
MSFIIKTIHTSKYYFIENNVSSCEYLKTRFNSLEELKSFLESSFQELDILPCSLEDIYTMANEKNIEIKNKNEFSFFFEKVIEKSILYANQELNKMTDITISGRLSDGFDYDFYYLGSFKDLGLVLPK